MNFDEVVETTGPAAPAIRYDLLDTEVAKAKFLPVYNQALQLKKEAGEIVVDSEEGAVACAEFIIQVKKWLKANDELRKKIIAEPDKFVRYTNGLVKPCRDIGLEILDDLSIKQTAWTMKVEQARREKEKAAKDEAARIQADIDARAKKLGVKPVELPQPIIPRKAPAIRTTGGTVSMKMQWTWAIEDVDKIPRTYLMADAKAIDAAVKAGIRNIDGISIFEEAKTTTRMS